MDPVIPNRGTLFRSALLRICVVLTGLSHPDSSRKAVISGDVRNGFLLLVLDFQLDWTSFFELFCLFETGFLAVLELAL